MEFTKRLALAVINKILPKILSGIIDEDLVANCANANDLNAARNAADAAGYAAGYAADAADAAANAAKYAADAANAAKYAAEYAAKDTHLKLAAKLAEDILIDLQVPACKYLYLLQE